MKERVKKITTNVKNNKAAWLMGVLNVIASVIIASGGIDISKNKEEITQTKSNTISLHRRITELEVKIAKMQEGMDNNEKTYIEIRKVILLHGPQLLEK